MSVAYPNVVNHPALSPAAREEQDFTRFLAQQELAELYLCLVEPAFTASRDVSSAEHAIALQVSYQYAQGMDAHVFSALSSERMESRSFRGSAQGAAVIHSGAKLIADQLLASRATTGGWDRGAVSVRGPF